MTDFVVIGPMCTADASCVGIAREAGQMGSCHLKPGHDFRSLAVCSGLMGVSMSLLIVKIVAMESAYRRDCLMTLESLVPSSVV